MSAVREGIDSVAREAAYATAQSSYMRCLASPDFFGTLYDTLLASDPAIPPMFARTEFPKQNKLLQHGLGLLLSYGRKPDPQLLDRIAARHGTRGLNVHPSLYVLFVDALAEAVRKHDPKCTADTEAAWRAIVKPGIDFMAQRYES